MTISTEAILFFAKDPNPALNFGDTPHEALFDICIRSIRHFSPYSKITLLTDESTSIADEYTDVECIRGQVRTEWIMYERARLYREHVERRFQEGSTNGLAFLDTDIIVTRDLSPIFELPFDVGLTTRVSPGITLNERGIHDDTKIPSPINGGVIFAKPTEGAVAFFAEQMAVYDELHAKGDMTFAGTVKDIRKWGGDQHALMAMVGKALVKSQPSKMQYKDTLVRFFPCETHNFSPDLGTAVTNELLLSKFTIHMKGARKKFMPAVAQSLRLP